MNSSMSYDHWMNMNRLWCGDSEDEVYNREDERDNANCEKYCSGKDIPLMKMMEEAREYRHLFEHHPDDSVEV